MAIVHSHYLIVNTDTPIINHIRRTDVLRKEKKQDYLGRGFVSDQQKHCRVKNTMDCIEIQLCKGSPRKENGAEMKYRA